MFSEKAAQVKLDIDLAKTLGGAESNSALATLAINGNPSEPRAGRAS